MQNISDNKTTQTASDIQKESLLIRVLPDAMRPYALAMRLDRPVGTWLLLLPSWWGILLAAPSPFAPLTTGSFSDHAVHALSLMALFAIGAIIMRGAGCIINDLWDRDIDQKVARTALRPIASGAISVKKAFLFLGLLLLLGLVILLMLPRFTLILGLASMVFVVAYPLMKRWTWWPQLFLGLTFNFGALMGWSAMTGSLDWPALLLYAGGIFWTLGYDTIYAAQDMEDDAKIGVRSSMLALQDKAPQAVAGFYSIATLLWAGALWMHESQMTLNASAIASAAALGFAAAHFIWQCRRWDYHDAKTSLRLFQSNRDAGLFLCIACFMI
jgi:4-hydroxybenzoate polyprenyltransferase